MSRSLALAALTASCILSLAVGLGDGGTRNCSGAENVPAKAGQGKAEDEDLLSREAIVPKGVVYKKATREMNRKAMRKLSDLLLTADKDASGELFHTTLICGPGLWRNIKDEPDMRKIKGGVTKIKETSTDGVQMLDGKLFQGVEEVKAFWTVFLRKYRFDVRTFIRRPTPRELGTLLGHDSRRH